MASFYDTVITLADLVFFFRMDETTGTVLHDSSINAFTGSVFPEAVLGRPSPVESDPGSFAISGAVGKLTIASAPAADVRNNSTWMVFGYHSPEHANGVLFCRSGQLGLGTSNFIAFDDGNIVVAYTCGGVEHVLTYPRANLAVDTWYFIRFTRNGTVATLHVNEVLVDQDITLGTDPMDITWLSDGWYFGRSQSANIFHSNGTDEAILVERAISNAEGLAVYESALNDLSIIGVSNVIPTATLDGSEIVESVSFPFRHNWDEVLIERISFRTDVSRARTGKESANAQRPIPRREFEFVQILRNNSERRRLRAQLWRNSTSEWVVPVRQDAQQLTVDVTASATTIACDTRYRDFEVGGLVGLRQLDDAGNILYWEEVEITALTDDAIECEPVSQPYSRLLSWVYPVKRALLDSSISAKGITDAVEEVRLTARLFSEDEALVPHRIIPWTPTLKYRDYEVFDPSLWPSHNWNEEREYEIERAADLVDFETGIVNWESDVIGAAEATPYSLILNGREEIARFLGWFYARQGQRRYLWVSTMQEDFEVLAVLSGNRIRVADTNYSDAFALAEPRRDLAFVYYDGSMVLRRVLGFADSPDEILQLDASVPSLTNLRSLSLLKFCRLDADQIELAWHTDDKVVVAFRFRELLHSPEGTRVSSLSPSASTSTSTSPSHSTSPSSSTSPSLSPSASSSPST